MQVKQSWILSNMDEIKEILKNMKELGTEKYKI